MKIEIIQTEDERIYNKSVYPTIVKTEKIIEIEKNTIDECFGYYFSEFSNRYKYCNDIHFKFKDIEIQKQYQIWIKNINNYYKYGGDMW